MIFFKNGVTRKTMFAPIIILILSLLTAPGWADEIAEATKEIVNKWQDAVVTTKIVIKMYEVERKTEAMATIIDPSGLAILSLSIVDPSSLRSDADAGAGAEITDIKMVMSDNNEVPAEIVMRDRDLDLIFIRPTEKLNESIVALDLTQNIELDVMDQIVILSHLGSVAGYAPSVSLWRINAVVKKPRTLYVPEFMAILNGLGVPAFTLDGKIVGILLLRISKSPSAGTGSFFGGLGGSGILPVILPAEEIIEVISKIPELNK